VVTETLGAKSHWQTDRLLLLGLANDEDIFCSYSYALINGLNGSLRYCVVAYTSSLYSVNLNKL